MPLTRGRGLQDTHLPKRKWRTDVPDAYGDLRPPPPASNRSSELDFQPASGNPGRATGRGLQHEGPPSVGKMGTGGLQVCPGCQVPSGEPHATLPGGRAPTARSCLSLWSQFPRPFPNPASAQPLLRSRLPSRHFIGRFLHLSSLEDTPLRPVSSVSALFIKIVAKGA